MRLTSGNPVHRLRHLLAAHDLDALSDAVLLARFAANRDEAAFTALVRRHSPLVRGTARRVLGCTADEDDVFQAVFLTLARKAACIRCDGTLAPWLYRVTFRTALRVRRQTRTVEPITEQSAAAPDPLAEMSARELCSAIDSEVARLSAGLRETVVLCCFQGLTRDEAAAQLGWSSATVKRRLAVARDLLDRRLRARGIALPVALAPVLLAVAPPASAETVAGTVAAALGRINPPVRVRALCEVTGFAAKTWAATAVATGILAVGLVLGLQPGSKSPTSVPAISVKAEKADASVELPVDPLPAGALARIGTTRFRHDNWLHQAVWSSDGKYIASSADRVLIVWEAATGRELARQTLNDTDFPPRVIRTENTFPSFIRTVEWAPDGHALLTSFNDAVQIWGWEPDAKRLVLDRKHAERPGPTSGNVLWADPLRIITTESSRLTVTDLPKNTTVRTIIQPDATFDPMVALPDGKRVVFSAPGERGHLLVLDWTTPDSKPVDLGVRATRLAVSGNGKLLAAETSVDDKTFTLQVWDTTTWKSRLKIPYTSEKTGGVRALALSPDGNTLVTGGADKTLRWWDTTTGKETRREGPGWVYYNRAAFRPDGKVLLTVSHENHVRLWDVETGKQLSLTAGPGWVIAATTFTPDGRRVLSVSENIVYCHDAATGKELWHGTEHTDTAVQIVVTPDGKTAISSGNEGRVIFRDVETGKVTRAIENPRHATDFLAISPDGRTLAALGGEAPNDAIVRRWDVATGTAYPDAPLPPKGPRYAAHSIRYLPDGSGLVIASGTELQVPVFDPDRKEFRQIFGPMDGGINFADVSADGRMIVAATAGDSIHVWETATSQQRLTLNDVGYTTCLAFSPDGRILAVANDGSHRLMTKEKTIEHKDGRLVVRLLDSFTGKEFHRFTGHTGNVYRLAWSADGRRLVSGSQDASALVWDVSPAVRAKLPTTAMSDDEVVMATTALTLNDSAKAYREMARLTAGPATAVKALRAQLKPLPAPERDLVAGLVRDLDSPQFPIREKAESQLLKIGEGVEGQLRTALNGKLSAEVRERVEKVLADLKPAANRLKQNRSLEILERIGDAEARRLLAELAAGADGAWLTREAKASLVRLTLLPR